MAATAAPAFRARPAAATLLFTTVFAALAAFGWWYIQIHQVSPSTPFLKLYFEQIESSTLVGGGALKRVWTGHEGTDDLLALLVSFFAPGTYARGEPGKVSGEVVRFQQAQLLLQLVSPLALQFVEGFRERNRWTLLSFPAVWAFCYQTMSGMCFFPVWYAIHTLLSHRGSYFSSGGAGTGAGGLAVRPAIAKGLAPTLLVLYLAPTVLMYIPFADPLHSQDAVAFWQAAPVYVNIGLWALALTVFRSSDRGSSGYARHITRAYKLAFAVGIATQVCLVWLVMTSSSDPPATFRSVLLPSGLSMEGVGFVFGAHRMFQWDNLGIFTSTALWAIMNIYDLQTRQLGAAAGGSGVLVPVLTLLAGIIVLGPGAALAAFGIWREKKIAKIVAAEEQGAVRKAQ